MKAEILKLCENFGPQTFIDVDEDGDLVETTFSLPKDAEPYQHLEV
jgi:hypothetical protein